MGNNAMHESARERRREAEAFKLIGNQRTVSISENRTNALALTERRYHNRTTVLSLQSGARSRNRESARSRPLGH